MVRLLVTGEIFASHTSAPGSTPVARKIPWKKIEEEFEVWVASKLFVQSM